MLEKIENDVKKLRLLVAQYKSLLDSDKIDLSIDKAKIELIKAEIKAGKTPKVPLEVAKVLIETTKSSVKLSEINIKTIEEKFKEKEAYIKYFEKSIEATERQESIRKNTNDSYTHIYFTNIEDAESRIEKAILRLKYRQAQRKKLYLETKRAEAIVKWLKAEHKLRNIYLRFNKVLDEENFVSFCCHE